MQFVPPSRTSPLQKGTNASDGGLGQPHAGAPIKARHTLDSDSEAHSPYSDANRTGISPSSTNASASRTDSTGGRKIRVLVVDDSIVYRKAISDVLRSDPSIEVVGQAADGDIALSKIESLKPDLITLDLEMPNRDGLGTLRALRQMSRPPKVIMCSTLSSHGALITIEALALGASDYITKPSNLGSAASSVGSMRDDLIPKIRQFFPHIGEGPSHGAKPITPGAADRGANHYTLPPRGGESAAMLALRGRSTNQDNTSRFGGVSAKPKPVAQPPIIRRMPTLRPKVLLIGVSTGGPNALAELIPKLPKSFPVPVLITQHMPPIFTRLLAERLNSTSQLVVEEASDGMQLLPGHAYLAPGNFHMGLRKEEASIVIALNQEPQENSCRPAVDHMFRHARDIYGGACLAVVLTGMGMDGLKGCRELKSLGGTVITQDEASSVVWGMPGFVTKEGLSDAVLDLKMIADEIIRRT